MDAIDYYVLACVAIVGIVIAKDASSRGMNGFGWGIFVSSVCIVALPLYLIVRKPRLDE